ncbi:CO/COL/TOC1, conserved site [Dillenia turbinata]|uniref:Protein TIFY n=1 Tax=Dillenia turbinata TaxID=194707 RepID=A0AAN8UFI4_9MAGN
MSTSSGSGKKFTVAQTCNRLSQFLKENRKSFGDLNLGMSAKLESKGGVTMDLWPNLERSVRQFPDFSSNESPNGVDSRQPTIPDSENAQFTIFYGGQVFVFENITSDKAKEIVLMASNLRPKDPVSAATAAADMIDLNNAADPIPVPDATKDSLKQQQLQPGKTVISDKRFMQMSSAPLDRFFNRFMEKRKERIAARAPYQVNNNPLTPPKPESSNSSWLNL